MPDHVSIADPDIHEPKGVAAASASQYYSADGAGSGSWVDPTVVTPTNVVSVESLTDLPTAVAGVITLADNTCYRPSGVVNLGSDRFQMGNNTYILGYGTEIDGFTSTTTSPLFTSSNQSIRIDTLNITCASADVFSFNGNAGTKNIVVHNVIVNDCDSIGTITDPFFAVFDGFSVFTTQTDGLTFAGSNCKNLNYRASSVTGFTGTAIDFGTSVWANTAFVGPQIFIDTGVGTTGLNVASASGNFGASGRGIIDGNNINGTGTKTAGLASDDLKWGIRNNFGIVDTNKEAHGYMHTSSTTTIGAADGDLGNPKLVTATGNWVDDLSDQFTVSTDGRFTYTGLDDTKFFVTCGVTGTTAAGTETINHYIAKNGTIITASKTQIEYASTANSSPSPVMSHATMSTNDYIELYVENSTGTNNWVSVILNMVVEEV